MSDPAQPLKELKKQHEFLVGIDSDGCVFDTMEIKQKECFIPNIVKYFDLQATSKYVRETAEFVNLYSKWRGVNRWPALLMVFDLLAERPEVIRRGAKLPNVESLRIWAKTETKLSNATLEALVNKACDPVLEKSLAWSKAVNATVEDIVHGVPPFPYVRESLEKLACCADAIVVSQTPSEALNREWQEHGIDKYPKVIAGQEMGTKTEHLAFAIAAGGYPVDKVLMIGDASGDLKAARANKCLFFPINPGAEEASWKRFYEEAFDRFIGGTYAGAYETCLIEGFDKCLPEQPPWK